MTVGSGVTTLTYVMKNPRRLGCEYSSTFERHDPINLTLAITTRSAADHELLGQHLTKLAAFDQGAIWIRVNGCFRPRTVDRQKWLDLGKNAEIGRCACHLD